MPPRPLTVPRHVETITISDDDDDHAMDDFDLAGAPQFPGNGPLNTPPDHDSDWEAVLRITRDVEAAENAQIERTNEMTEDDCLARILEVFSDIAHKHVVELFRAKKAAGKEANGALCDEMIVEILDGGNYPKEREVRRENLKRKYQASSEEPEPSVDTPRDSTYKNLAIRLLLNEFLFVPQRFINSTIKDKKSAFHAYLVIEEADRQYSDTAEKDRQYRRLVKPRTVTSIRVPSTDTMLDGIQREVASAKRKAEKDTRKRKEKERKVLEEEKNEAVARANGEMTECGCCFCECPTNRMTFCNGEQLHFFCYDCARSYVSNEIGQRKCRPKCMDTGGCSAEFSRSQLKAFLEQKLFDTLERLQQQQDLRDAGIEDLEECPFCDFKAICLPKEVDREFRCLNDECLVVSCRLCQQETHIPVTCEQAAKDKKIDVRHKVEEAMTAALIRGCNKCKNKFIKDYGCNKMTCTSCGNIQCYVCSKDVKDYNHFNDRQGGCPLYENTEQRHEEEVKKAEQAAFEELKKQNPTIDDQDLKIQVSEAVKKADKDRIKRGARHAGAVGAAGYHPGVIADPAAHLAAYYAVPPLARVPQLQDVGRAPRPRPAVVGEANRREGACPCHELDAVGPWYPRGILGRLARARGCHCGRYENENPEPPAAAAAAAANPQPNLAQMAGLGLLAQAGNYLVPPPPFHPPMQPHNPILPRDHHHPLVYENMRQRRQENAMQEARIRQMRLDRLEQQAQVNPNRLVGRMMPQGDGGAGVRNPQVAELQRFVDHAREQGRRRQAELERAAAMAMEDARRVRLGRAGRAGQH